LLLLLGAGPLPLLLLLLGTRLLHALLACLRVLLGVNYVCWKEVVFVFWFDQFVVWCDQWRLEWAGVAQMSFCYRCNMNE
jgi:hypothetical protein